MMGVVYGDAKLYNTLVTHPFCYMKKVNNSQELGKKSPGLPKINLQKTLGLTSTLKTNKQTKCEKPLALVYPINQAACQLMTKNTRGGTD